MTLRQEDPSNIEDKRLAALKSYNVLDTMPEKEYDAITRLASYICQVPVALITLLDAERQWFKSAYGVDVGETPRADAFCNRTIQSDALLEIADSKEDEEFKDNPAANEMGVRFYAGAPLIDPDGHRLGSLCVIDTKPRKLTAEQRDALRTLADEVMSHLLLRKQKLELEKNLKSHQEFHNLFDSSPDIHCIMDRDFIIEQINRSAKSVLGYSPVEVIGKPIWSFFQEEERAKSLSALKKGLGRQQRHFEIEANIITPSGDIKCISWSVTFKSDKWFASGRDISYQKKVANELALLSLVASRVTSGVVISNAADEVIWTNEAFEQITGYNQADVENRRLRDVLKGVPLDAEAVKRLDEAIRNQVSYEVDLLIDKKGGEPVWISVFNSVIRDSAGQTDKFIRVIIDITQRKKIEQELEILSFAARKSPSGILIRSNTGEVIWMNEALENITGYTFDEMRGKMFGTMLVGEDTDLNVFKAAVKAVEEKRGYEVEIKVYKKDKTPIWIFLSNSPLFNETGSVERQIAVMVDITERKKTEEQVNMLSLVASSTASGVVINNSDGKVEWVNKAFEQITGYTLLDVKDNHLGDVLKGELTDVSIIQKARELSRNKQSFEVDLLVYRKDRQPLWISVINSVIINSKGEVDKYIEVIIDITAKKKAEIELINAREEAVQLSRAKDMFISVMSHEIRTPLNAVIGMSHLLLEDDPLDGQKENLNILKFSAENLMTLINDVLDFAKIETGNVELEKERVDLTELVQSITSSMQYKAAEKNIYISKSIDEAIPKVILGDRTRLIQILLNLVGNAIKFTEKGGVTIDLKVIQQSEQDVRIRFAVIDTGIGIAANKLGTIFEQFKQAELDTTRKFGGTGLGLAISKRLIELHDSRINVDSVPGQGSTFWFTIGFKKGDYQSNRNSNNVEEGLKINVLVVDDNQINRLLINKILKKWGASADFAENGIEAIEKVETNRNYNVVLMDIHMPEMGGLEATGIIRAKTEAYFQQLPIIALTASMLSNQMGEINNAGMNDYILKPFDPRVLYDKLSRYQQQ
ncbi:PAS domain-containing protein [Mucilaginibacter rubeus]|uniref:histidine kinase n=2 Tax=Mucilaginibacter TaxID=423349 RepID=A0AAE6JHP9_9SPHI|nr:MULTISPECIES: PAS domain-containing protein [Mucilaginibacter]QEM05894.1 PAS domain-containing protein [Mucilaginibacter rubeus]QEM18475.1 PAS domain-containing protein [Mucilaginibacter gossypii]QTE44986.1 PAS domain-containing protein [Mucilaginibacter rubeus]QTE51583.1 PAS domain-containing protein [Mucilaginibacter rubeus]QTE56670.1 PAS domain-containing protein [Mucilaginibacter rubeus]